jgi:hypothetical protein
MFSKVRATAARSALHFERRSLPIDGEQNRRRHEERWTPVVEEFNQLGASVSDNGPWFRCSM